MNPHRQNKVDISSLSADEQKVFRLYGKLPNKTDLLQNKLKERKYFDSGDYALSKAGKSSEIGVTQIGREHPSPENIPHSSSPHNNGAYPHHGSISGISLPTPPGQAQSGSPVKESSFLHRETSASDVEDDAVAENEKGSQHAKNKPVAIEK